MHILGPTKEAVSIAYLTAESRFTDYDDESWKSYHLLIGQQKKSCNPFKLWMLFHESYLSYGSVFYCEIAVKLGLHRILIL